MLDENICFVEFVPEDTLDPQVRAVYDILLSKQGRVGNLYKAMSLSPFAIAPADELYRQTLHTQDCPLEPWLRELVATQVAMICKCKYATVNHQQNFHDLFQDEIRSAALLEIVSAASWRVGSVDPRLAAILTYNHKLAKTPELMEIEDIVQLRRAGLSDKEIVYLTQISASFAYWCRVINALGISLGDEPVGLSGWKIASSV